MLRELRLRNFAVVESVTVAFAAGLNVLTGETGAGKAILVDASVLVRGGRAQTDVIRADAETATVEALFALGGADGARSVLDDAGLVADDNGEIVVRRELARSGRHRAFVNDSPVTVGLLERLGDALVEVHGQHEHQRLLEPARQLELLDRFADAEEAAARGGALHAKYRAAVEEAERTRAAARDRAQREDLLRFQVSELDAARLRVGEDDELRGELRRLQRAERFTTGLAEAAALLDEAPQSASERLARALKLVQDLGRLDPMFAAPAGRLGGQVERTLRALGMDRAVFAVVLERVPEPGPRGADRVELRISTNPGEEPKALARVASGGELSRTMLALKSVLARADRVPVLVFDEVDAGIGGRVASVVAQTLSTAAAGRQVLCVTHLPPIAALADHHVQVTKTVRGGRTRVAVAALTGDARVEAVARMLGGATTTAAALQHARDLLGARGGPRRAD